MTKDFKKRIRKKAFKKRQNLLIKIRSKECNMTTRKKQIESTNSTILFQIVIMINESRHRAMIDSSSENNYVSTILMKRENFSTRLKNKNVFEAYVIEEEFVDKMNQKIRSLFVVIQ